MAGLAYYQNQPYFKKQWQRIGVGLVIMLAATAVGTYFEKLVEKRYSTFKGRTSLYGSATVRNGWLNTNKE